MSDSEQAERLPGDVQTPGQACPQCRGPLVEEDGHTVCRACAMWWWSVDNAGPTPGETEEVRRLRGEIEHLKSDLCNAHQETQAAMDGELAPAAIVLHSGEPGPRELHLFARLEDARRWAAECGGEVIRISEAVWHGAGDGEGGGA